MIQYLAGCTTVAILTATHAPLGYWAMAGLAATAIIGHIDAAKDKRLPPYDQQMDEWNGQR